MKKIYKSFLALLLGTTLTIGCLTGCGSKDASSEDTTTQESEVKDKGILLMESTIIKVYANDNVITFDCNNDEGVEDYDIEVYDNGSEKDVFNHDQNDGASEDLIYTCEISDDGDYTLNLMPYSETKSYDDYYSVDIILKDHKVDTDSFHYYQWSDADNVVPKLTIYGTDLEVATEESTSEESEEKENAIFKIDGKELPLDSTFAQVKEIFSDYDIRFEGQLKGAADGETITTLELDKEYEVFSLYFVKDGRDLFRISGMNVTLTEDGVYSYAILDAPNIDFSIEIEGRGTIDKDVTQDELINQFGGYQHQESIVVIPCARSLIFEYSSGYLMFITISDM